LQRRKKASRKDAKAQRGANKAKDKKIRGSEDAKNVRGEDGKTQSPKALEALASDDQRELC
jgi:hypothetical protein